MDKNRDKDAVTKRILETTRETERLKEELQNLIAAGIQGNLSLSIPNTSNKSPLHYSNKVQIIKSYDSKHSLHPKDIPNAKSEALSPKKNKKYDVQQARDYIKKQREKRMAESKSKKSESKTTLELRKEKLQELQQRATELVKKNVEAKRQRSKSREPPIIRSRSPSREVKHSLKLPMSFDPEVKHVPGVKTRSKSREAKVVRSRSTSRENRSTLRQPWSSYEPIKKHTLNWNFNDQGPLSREAKFKNEKERKFDRDSIIHGYNCAGRSKKYLGNNLGVSKHPKPGKAHSCEQLFIREPINAKDPNLLYPPQHTLKPLEEPSVNLGLHNLETVENSEQYNNPASPASISVSERSSDKQSKKERSRRDIFLKDVYVSNQITSRNTTTDHAVTEPSKSKISPVESLNEQEQGLIIHSNLLLKPPSDERHIQKQHDFPDWLKDSAPQTDPYNFINTVRRQLKYVVGEKKSTVVDVAVQDSAPPTLKSSKRTDLKSFISHKCLNLDPHALDHIEIGLQKEPSVKGAKGTTKSTSNSESDTSKNIPSISSESRTSLRKPAPVKSSSRTMSDYSTFKTVSSESASQKSDSVVEILKPKSDFSAFESNSESHISAAISERIKSKQNSEKSVGMVSTDKRSVSIINSEITENSNKENISRLSSRESKRSESRRVRTVVDKPASLRNVTVRSENERRMSTKANQIHLKFEAEIHLLNDFNKSLRHFAEIEKEFESLRSRNDADFMAKKIVLNRDTQTSVVNSLSESRTNKKTASSLISTINYSRGSFDLEETPQLELTYKSQDNSEVNLSGLDSKIDEIDTDNLKDKTSSIVQISNQTISKKSSIEGLNNENIMFTNFAGISLKMFDQLINDEDVRIENLKKIVKIREQVLLDKTKSELVWLEMQKKQFIETKRFEDAALIKRKQRAILLKHQEERLEMQRLKQMQKETSNKRKTVLKQQRDGIKNQLHSGNMLSILKPTSRERHERRTSGPLKVIQTNSIHSETSLSIAATGTDQEMKSIATRTHSMINVLSAPSDNRHSELESMDLTIEPRKSISDSVLSNMKQKLLMREKALAKRRKTVEELLQWHQKLLREERAIEDLESKVKNIFTNTPSEKDEEIVDPVGLDVTGASEQNVEQLPSEMSKNIPQSSKDDLPTEETSKIDRYSADFEAEDRSNISSISQLIEDFNKIEDNILNISLAHPAKHQLENTEDKVEDSTPETVKSTSSSPTTSEISEVQTHKPAIEEEIISDKSSVTNIDLDTEKLPGKDTEHHDVPVEDLNKNESSLIEKEIDTAVPSESEEKLSENNDECVETTAEELVERGDALNVAESVKELSIITLTSTSESDSESQSKDDSAQEINVCDPENEIEILPEEPSKTVESIAEEKPSRSHSETVQSSNRETTENLNASVEVQSILEDDHLSSPQLNESVPELVGIKESTPSTSHHASDQILSEVNEHEEVSFSPTTSSDLRQYSENKTDEEKVASLSTKTTSREVQNYIQSNEEIYSPTDNKTPASLTEEGHSASSGTVLDNKTPASLTEQQLSASSATVPDYKTPDGLTEERLSASSATGSDNKTSATTTEERLSASSVILPDKTPSSLTEERLSARSVTVAEQDQSSTSSVVLDEDIQTVEASNTSPQSSRQDVSAASPEKSSKSDEKSQKPVDVKKRVQEILGDSNSASRGDKSPRMQDLCVMTYDLLSPAQSPDAGSPLDERKSFSLGNEAEELLKKQLAIEQEIKLLTEQQQKEQIPLVYMREIPNKPPPPYTPPSKAKPLKGTSIIPNTKDEIQQITEYSAKIIHKAYLSNNLDNISISDKTLSLIAKNIDKGCYKYVFNLCKDIAIDHYTQFDDEAPGPSWMRIEERSFSTQQKPLDVTGLQQLMNKKLLELFGFQRQEIRRENAIMKWSRKKRDHVDEVLIQEMQTEEKTWTNIDQDELLVKNRITNEIMDMLLKETVQVLKKSITKKNKSQ